MKKRAIVFGIGRNWEKRKDWILKEFEVMALIDNNPDKAKEKDVHPVNYLMDETCPSYDLIYIITRQYEEMYNQLLEMGINPNKISILSLERAYYKKEILGYSYYGQHTDDLILAAIFSMIGVEKPSYIDLGANHPWDISNTAFLYEQGCRGINIEANPNLAKIIKMARPEDITLNVGVSVQNGGALPFYVFDEGSGLNTFSKTEAEKWGIPIKKVIDLPVVSLDYVIETYCPNGFPDFLDCDIEGLDYDVLDGYDLKKNGPKVICVEVRPDEIERFDVMLKEKDYYRFCRLGENNIYVKIMYSQVLSHVGLD